MTKRMSVAFPKTLYQRINQLAKEQRRSFSEQVVFLLLEYFKIIDKINGD